MLNAFLFGSVGGVLAYLSAVVIGIIYAGVFGSVEVPIVFSLGHLSVADLGWDSAVGLEPFKAGGFEIDKAFVMSWSFVLLGVCIPKSKIAVQVFWQWVPKYAYAFAAVYLLAHLFTEGWSFSV